MKRLWTPEELSYLEQHFADNYTASICEALNRSYASVVGKAKNMSLSKSEAFTKMELQRQGERLVKSSVNSRFQKGQISHNKGIKFSEEVKAKMSRTWFRKGHEPHNTTYNGYERTDAEGYTYIRISKRNFVLKQRWLWEQTFGEIPKNCTIAFRDGNRRNCKIENLELVPRAEMMLRNTIHRLPSELISNIKMLSKINKLIKQRHEK